MKNIVIPLGINKQHKLNNKTKQFNKYDEGNKCFYLGVIGKHKVNLTNDVQTKSFLPC